MQILYEPDSLRFIYWGPKNLFLRRILQGSYQEVIELFH